MASLKDQLEKLGFKESPDSPKPEKRNRFQKRPPHKRRERPSSDNNSGGQFNRNRRPEQRTSAPPVVKKEIVAEQKQRSFCESCDQVAPDVEYYDHPDKRLKARWLCIRCADKFNIHDDYRRTAQSESVKRRSFRREYGPTYPWGKIRARVQALENEQNKK